MPEYFAPSSVWVRNQMPWRKQQTTVLPRDFLHEPLRNFDELKLQMLYRNYFNS